MKHNIDVKTGGEGLGREGALYSTGFGGVRMTESKLFSDGRKVK